MGAGGVPNHRREGHGSLAKKWLVKLKIVTRISRVRNTAPRRCSVLFEQKNVRPGLVWGHTPEQRVAASTLRQYAFGLRLAIAQADARLLIPVSFM